MLELACADMLDRIMMTFSGTVGEFEPNQEDWMQHVKQLGHSVLACIQRYSTFTHLLKCNL